MADAPPTTPPAVPPTEPVPPAAPPAAPPTPPAEPPVPPAEPELGEAGKRALDSERAARRDAEKRAKDVETELAALRATQMTDQEKAIEAARAEGRAEAVAASNVVILKAHVLAAAAGKLADPNDAIKLIALDQFTPTADGEFDTAALAASIDALLAAKPYLGINRPGATPPPGSANGGPQGGGPAQWTQEQLDQATPEQIIAAKNAGLLNTLMGI